MLHIFFFIAFSGTQGRIQDFAQGGGARFKIYTYITRSSFTTARSAVPFCAKNFGGSAPPINIIRIITLGKTHLKKWSEPLRKIILFYDLKKNY